MEELARVRPLGVDFDLDVVARHAEWYEIEGYEPATTALFRTIVTDADFVLDIGSHIGYYAFLARSVNERGSVVAVEPSPDNVAVLTANQQTSGLSIDIVAAAFGAAPGSAVLHISEASDNAALAPHPSSPVARTLEVPVVSATSLDLPAGAKAVVKIDVEGFEVAVLDGLAEVFDRYADVRLLVELNPACLAAAGSSPGELLTALADRGYRAFSIADNERTWREVTEPGDWESHVPAAGYVNVYAVRRELSLSIASVMHSGALGGAERTHLELVESLVRQGAMIADIVPMPDQGLRSELLRLGGSVDLVPTLSWWWTNSLDESAEQDWRSTSARSAAVVDAIARVAPDLVLTETGVVVQGALAAAELGIPHVWWLHEFGDVDHGLVLPGEVREVGELVRALSVLVLANSRVVAKHFYPGFNAEDRIAVVHPQPVVANFEPVRRTRLPWTLGVVGGLTEGKGQHEAIEAIAVLREQGIDVPLALVGAGVPAEVERLEGLARERGVADLVTITGWVDRGSVFDAVDAVAVTSRSEAFGRVPFEATAAGRLVIFADSAGPTEYLTDGETGIAYRLGDAQSLAAAILRARDDAAQSARLVRAARADLLSPERRARFDADAISSLRAARGSDLPPLSILIANYTRESATGRGPGGSDWLENARQFWAMYRELEVVHAKRVVGHERALEELANATHLGEQWAAQYEELDRVRADEQITLAALVADREAVGQRLARAERALREREEALQRATERVADAERVSSDLRSEIDRIARLLAALEASRAFRAVTRVRNLVNRVAPGGTHRRGLYERSLRAAVRVARVGRRRPRAVHVAPPPRLAFVEAAEPLVSIIIPVYGKWDFTERCLRSLAAYDDGTPIEIIVVDDASKDDTVDRLAGVEGVRVLALDENHGFTRAANAGIAEARGRHLLLLNNDTEVTEGWLAALLDAATPGVGVVGAKLVYPDGRLQEAGGIIFDDASGWNYGKFDDPELPPYNFRKPVDYCSGAAILLTRELLDLVPGFDERYAPAYYEDVDIAFEARRHGLAVLFEPRAVVIHHEGISHGTSEAEGIKRFQAINREKFAEKWAVELADHFPAERANHNTVALPAMRRSRGTVVVVDHMVPQWREDAGSLRMWRMLESLSDLGYEVVFIPENRFPSQPYTADLQRLGVLVWTGWSSWQEHLRSIQESISFVLVSRQPIATAMLHQLRSLLPEVPFAFDTVDLHFLREERESDLRTGGSGPSAAARVTRALELAMMRASDATVVVSQSEKDLLNEIAPDVEVFVVPTVHDSVDVEESPEDRTDIVFVGSFQHPPNADGVRWFLEDVMPLVRKSLPDVPVRIIGRNPPESLGAAADGGVVLAGWVEDLEPVHRRTRISIAPLRYGAGVKGKVGEAWAHGVPVVMTSVAAEGMFATHGENALIADSAEEFAAAIVRLYGDTELWRGMSREGRSHVTRLFGKSRISDTLGELARFLDSTRPPRAR